MSWLFLVSATFALLVGSASAAPAATAASAAAQTTARPAAPRAPAPVPQVHNAVKHDLSARLSTLKPVKNPASNKVKVIPLHNPPHSISTKQVKTANVQSQATVTTNTMPGFQQNFEGVGNLNGVLPPDTQGAVGPSNYVQMINLSFAVYDKQGNLQYGPVPNTTLWQGFGGPCETLNGGDPVTIYDEAANRWFMSQLSYPGGSQGYHECIAVSQTGDPTGAWYRYDYLFSSNTLNDYPKFGVWNDAYYMSANDFLNGQSFSGVTAVAFNRAAMLAGQAAQEVSFSIGPQYASLLPSNAAGQALGFKPPPGSPNPFFMSCDAANGGPCSSDQMDMWNFHVDWANPANSTFGNNGAPSQTFPVATFNSNLCNFNRSCIPQPGTSVGLDALSDRLMYQAAYRNLGSSQALVLNQTVNVGTSSAPQAGVRWYELTNTGSGWSLGQQGTYAPDSGNRWMASANVDASGDIAVGYSVSSSSTYPSIGVAGRLVGDPAGQLAQGEATLVAGGGSQTSSFSRWGDYSAMQVDPTDGCTYWYTSEYLPSTTDSSWHTRIGSFKFPSCTAGAHGDIAGTVTDSSTSKPIAGATVATSTTTTTTDSQGRYDLTLPTGSYDLTDSAFGYQTKTVTGVQVTDGGTTTQNAALTPSPAVHVTGTVTDGSGHGYPLYTRIDITGRPGGPVWTNPATGQYSVDLPANATYSMKFTTTLPGYQVVSKDVNVGSSDQTENVAIPVTPSCTAPGYQFNYGTPALSESFDGTTMPAGWTVVDNKGNGQVWGINDKENHGNLTGGSGNFADINSDYYRGGQSQDTSLVTPVMDLSGESTPVLKFHNDYFGYPGQTGGIDVSTDGGQTWTNVWEHTNDSVRGPDLEQVPLPQGAGKNAVQVRFHFTSSFGWWWQIDDVSVQNRTCDPIPGGLVVGRATDANTGKALNGATVTSTDNPADKAITAATPDDPSVGDGYYWMFSSLTGAHPFTAAKGGYQTASQTVNVAADGTTRADFSPKAGQLTVTPSSISTSQVLGNTTTSTVKITNTGTAPANLNLFEQSGAFQILTKTGSPLRRIQLADGSPATPGFLGNKQGTGDPAVDAGPPANPGTWSTTASYPSSIMDNSADYINGKEYSVGGVNGSSALVANGYVYNPSADAWTAIASMPTALEKPAAAAVNGKLYVTGGWDSSGNVSPATNAYNPSSDTWSSLSANPNPVTAPGNAVIGGKIYLVGGCKDGNCTASSNVEVYNTATDSWSTAAPYPHPDSWESCGAINGKVYCAGGINGFTTYSDAYVYDPATDTWSPIASMPTDLWGSVSGGSGGLLVVSSGVTAGSSTITNQGYAYDPATDSWTAIANAQFPRYRAAGSCGFYKIGGSSGGFSPTADSEVLSGLTQCGVVDVPWLAETPATATLQPGQSTTVTVTLSATTADKVTQPGTYTAGLGLANDTPYTVNPIGITMTVTPPAGWGKADGTVTGTSCTQSTAPLYDVLVQANGKTYTFSLPTDRNGSYAFWAPAASDPFTLIAAKDGWIPQTTKVNLKAGKTVTTNFSLQRVSC
jgi:N-acetylneuraminic acid mutarotase